MTMPQRCAIESRAVTRMIWETIAAVCGRCFSHRNVSVILTGSLARNEGSFVRGGAGWLALSDADLLFVFSDSGPLPADEEMSAVSQSARDALARQDIECGLSVAAVRPEYLRRLTPTLFAHELRLHGRVVWGNSDILMLIPGFSVRDVPLDDAWRLLANRIVELLEVCCQLTEGPSTLPLEVHYRTHKLYRDIATSFLLFEGIYEPTYSARAASLRKVISRGACPDLLLARLAEHVCAPLELSGTAATIKYWREAIEHARLLWDWELARLAGGGSEGWMTRQPWLDRARGWCHAARECGPLESARQCFHWGRLAGRGSPRYCVYTVASQLLFQAPVRLGLATENDAAPELTPLANLLPIATHAVRDVTWRGLAADVAMNYRRFVENTSA